MEHLFGLVGGFSHYFIHFVVVLSVVVFVHEFGHYWVARRCGVRVEQFSIGFGPELFGWNDSHGTRWKFSLLPLGGFVKMFGDSDPSSFKPDEKVQAFTEDEKKVAFYSQPVGKRAAIVAAGPAANYIFAIIVLAFLFVFNGQPFTPPVAGTIVENSVAARAGFEVGDKVIMIDGEKVERFEDIRRIVSLNSGTEIKVQIERNGTLQDIAVTPEVVKAKDRFGGEHITGRIGLGSTQLDYRKLDPVTAVGVAVAETWNITAGTLKAVGQMIMGTRSTDELGGPLRIAEMSGNVARDGVIALIWFMAVISINLGLINLFPIPLLDGGHLVYYGAEKVRGRPLSEKVQEYGMRFGLACVLTLMVVATWNDLVHLKVVQYITNLFS